LFPNLFSHDTSVQSIEAASISIQLIEELQLIVRIDVTASFNSFILQPIALSSATFVIFIKHIQKHFPNVRAAKALESDSLKGSRSSNERHHSPLSKRFYLSLYLIVNNNLLYALSNYYIILIDERRQ
jgi:hypothetical protein